MDKHTVKYDDNDDNNDNTIMLPKSLPISIPKPVQKSNQQLFGFFGAYHQQQQPIDLDHHHHYHLFHSHDRQTNHHHSQQQQQLSQQNKPINTNNMFISSNSVEEFNQVGYFLIRSFIRLIILSVNSDYFFNYNQSFVFLY